MYVAHKLLEAELHQKLSASPPPILSIHPRCPQSNSPFLSRLPLEIRRQIYNSVLAPDTRFKGVNFQRIDEPSNSVPGISLLLTCTRIYREAGPLLYTLNPIHISLEGCHSETNLVGIVHLVEEYIFPPRGNVLIVNSQDAPLPYMGEARMPEVTYGSWRRYLSAEHWAVATLVFYIDPYWPTWSIFGGDCLKWWTLDPVVRPPVIKVVVWAVAQMDSIPFQVHQIADAIHHVKGLQEGTLELRTLKGREPRLDEYILRLLRLRISLVEGVVLEWDQNRPVVWDGERERGYEKVGMEPEDCPQINTWDLPYEERSYCHEPKELERIWWIRIRWAVRRKEGGNADCNAPPFEGF